MFKIAFNKKSVKYLRKMPNNWRVRVISKINTLAKDPHASNNNVAKLVGRDAYRLKVGDFRVIYHIHNDVLIIDVVDIGSRGGIYQ